MGHTTSDLPDLFRVNNQVNKEHNVETTTKPFEILLVDDNDADVRLTQVAFKNSHFIHNLHTAMDGIEAMNFLRKIPPYENMKRPDVVLLDLNMPRKNGREVLEEVKNDPDLKRIPIIILTTSDNDLDILNCYDLHANCYINKPVDFVKFITVVQHLQNFWFQVVTLPND